jgi:hypothetical protein
MFEHHVSNNTTAENAWLLALQVAQAVADWLGCRPQRAAGPILPLKA